MAYQLETIQRIYSDCGFYYEVRPDPDGLGNIEIRYFEDVDDKECKDTIVLTQEAIEPLIDALCTQLNILKDK